MGIMAGDWTPDGYMDPKEYDTNKKHVYIIAVLLVGFFGIGVRHPFLIGLSNYYTILGNFAESAGVSDPVVVKIGTSVTFIIGVLVLFFVLVTPLHEAIHYGVGRLFKLNPEFGYEEAVFFKNPRVVALSTDIPDWMNILMIITPFVVISVLSWGLIQISTGLLAGVAAVILWLNSVSSAQDLYHCSRIFQMEPGTKFANFETDGEVYTEYAMPEQ